MVCFLFWVWHLSTAGTCTGHITSLSISKPINSDKASTLKMLFLWGLTLQTHTGQHQTILIMAETCINNGWVLWRLSGWWTRENMVVSRGLLNEVIQEHLEVETLSRWETAGHATHWEGNSIQRKHPPRTVCLMQRWQLIQSNISSCLKKYHKQGLEGNFLSRRGHLCKAHHSVTWVAELKRFPYDQGQGCSLSMLPLSVCES